MKTCLALLLLLAAGSPSFSQPEPAEDASPLMDRPQILFGDLDEIRRRGVIRVLVTHNRTNFFVDQGGRPRGFEYELLKEYEKSLRGRVKGRFSMVFLPVPFHRLLPDLIAGRGDVAAAALTITPERREIVDFSDPYLSAVDQVVVTHRTVPDLNRLEDLAGRRIHVLRSSSYAEHLQELSAGFADRGLPAIEVVEAPAHLESEDLLELVHAGVLELTVVDRHLAELWSNALTDLVVRDDLRIHGGGRIAWAVRPQDRELLADLNRFVKEHRKGTLLGNIFFKRYYRNVEWIRNPTDEERRRLAELRGLAEKYAERYGFDWLMIGALAFQESGLDHGVRSRAGAVGIMQVLPATAADPSIGIPDVEDLENNIHAGVKYLDWIRTHYFNDAEIPPAAKVDFTLAAYNAGPNRIARLRRQAAAAGHDPNRWFGNVELVALREIGWETVRYVANINKYYFAFKLRQRILRQRQEELEAIRGPGS